jgi:hypothetical protein
MTANAGYHLFSTGDVLTAAQVQYNLQNQTIMYFASSAARTSALNGVLVEGMFSYLADTNSTEYYDGAAWQSISNPGDITAVSAGNGLSGGGTSGAVSLAIDTAITVDKTTAQTLTNKTLTSPALTTPTISTLTTNGDLVYGTGSGALSRLGIGSSAQVLTVSSGLPSWATPASGGGMTLITTLTFNNTVTNYTVSSGLSGYKQLFISGTGLQTSSTAAYDTLLLRFNGDSTSGNYDDSWVNVNNSTATGNYGDATNIWLGNYCLARNAATSQYFGNLTAWIQSPDSTSAYKGVTFISGSVDDGTPYRRSSAGRGEWNSTAAITSINLRSFQGSNLKAGIVLIYGVN